jgi:hypothetical protein
VEWWSDKEWSGGVMEYWSHKEWSIGVMGLEGDWESGYEWILPSTPALQHSTSLSGVLDENMEFWSNGLKTIWKSGCGSLFPALHYSSTPFL